MTSSLLRRLTVAAGRSRAVLEGLGQHTTVVDLPQRGRAQALALCRGGRLATLAGALSGNADVLCALTPPVAIDFLLSGDFDGLIVDEPSLDGAALDAIERVRHHSQLSDVPVLALARPGGTPSLMAAGATRVVEISGLAAAFAEEVGPFRRLSALKQQLRLMKGAAAADAALLSRHLAIAFETREAPLALGVIDVGLDGGHPAPPMVIRTVASLLASLTRAEDIVAQISAGRFAILFCGLEPDRSEPVLARLGAVAGRSAILSADGDGAVVSPRLTHAILDLAGYRSEAAVWMAVDALLKSGHAARPN